MSSPIAWCGSINTFRMTVNKDYSLTSTGSDRKNIYYLNWDKNSFGVSVLGPVTLPRMSSACPFMTGLLYKYYLAV